MKNFPKIIIIFLAVDWDLFNRREMVKALAEAVKKYGSTVIAVNRPLCPLTTFIKKRHRVKELFAPAKVEKLDSNLVLYSPKYILHDHIAGKSGSLQRLNINSLRRSLESLFKQLKIEEEKPLVWYYYPQQGYVSEIFKNRFLIFELYDDMRDVQGKELASMTAQEKLLKKRVDLFIVEVKSILREYSPGYKNSYLFGNGLSRETFESLKQLPVRKRQPNDYPTIGYAGMVSERLDWGLIKQIALKRPEWNFLFHGMIADENIVEDFYSSGLKNVGFSGSFRQDQLPSILGKYDIALLPYLNNEFLNHIHPLKFFEYAAAGLPIVSSVNYELTGFSRYLLQMPEQSADGWIAAIERQLSSDYKEQKRIGVQIAEQYVWDIMCEKFIDKVSEFYI